MNRARREHRVKNGEFPRQARSENPSKRFTLAEPELFHAKFEHRRKPRAQVQPPLFDFAEVRDGLRRDFPMRAPDLPQQIAIRNIPEIHANSHSTRDFSPISAPLKRDRSFDRKSKRTVRKNA